MARRRRRGPTNAPARRSRLGVAPIIAVLGVFIALVATTGLAVQQNAPTPTPPLAATFTPSLSAPGPGDTLAPLHKFAADQENGFIASCMSDPSSASVPQGVAQAFCVCTLNQYETMYPSYDALQAAQKSGALDENTRTQIANRCVSAILGG